MIRPAIDIAIVIVTVCVLYTFFSGRAQEKRAAPHTRCLACLLEGHGASTYGQHFSWDNRQTPTRHPFYQCALKPTVPVSQKQLQRAHGI